MSSIPHIAVHLFCVKSCSQLVELLPVAKTIIFFKDANMKCNVLLKAPHNKLNGISYLQFVTRDIKDDSIFFTNEA